MQMQQASSVASILNKAILNTATFTIIKLLYQQKFLKHGVTILLLLQKQSCHVALAGETAGGIRVRLDFFCYFFVSRQKK